MFLYSQWTKLPINTRHTIAAAFGIRKTSSTEVANNQVVKDGYALGDIESRINVDELQKYLNTDVTDMAVLWTMLVDKTEGRTVEPTKEVIVPVVVEEVVVIEVEGKPSEPLKKKRGRPTKVK